MHTRWLTMLMLAGATGTLSAQLPKIPRLGLFIGGTEAQVDGSVSDISNRTGVAFGAYGVIPIDQTWSAEPGAFYSMKGWKRVEPGTGDQSIVKLNYFEIPLLMRVNLGASAAPSLFGAFIKGGFGLGFRATCSIETKDASSNVTASASCDDIETASSGTVKFKSFDVGAIIGGGVRRRVGRQDLVLSAQYELGLSKIQDNNDITNRTLTFGIALEVPVRR
jgi:hypothetical protein